MTGSLNSITSTAASGLRASQLGIAVLSENIANAGVAGYTAKRLDLATFHVGGSTNGVRTGLVSRSVDEALQTSLWTSTSRISALDVRSQVLQAVNATQGVPGDGTSLADAVATLQSKFTLLQAQPAGATLQAAVASSAGTLAETLNRTSAAIAHERNGVQDRIVAAVDTLNAALDTVRATTADIIKAVGAGEDSANLQDERDTALRSLSGLLDLHYDKQANGDLVILGRNGFSFPLQSRFATEPAVLSSVSSYAPGSTSVPPVLLLDGNPATPAEDVTRQLSGGELGELVKLRDATLPAYTASLDALAAKIANRFADQGLHLFTDGGVAGTLPVYPGLAGQIQVNPAVLAAPSLIRNGTAPSAFPINPPGGPAGFADLIGRVLSNTFPAGPGSSGLAADAQSFVSRQATAAGQATGELAGAQSYQTRVAAQLSDSSAVNVDHEMGLMIQLQNSYQANARVVQTTQALFLALLDATR